MRVFIYQYVRLFVATLFVITLVIVVVMVVIPLLVALVVFVALVVVARRTTLDGKDDLFSARENSSELCRYFA